MPQMWSMNTQAMKRSDITSTGTGPTCNIIGLIRQGETKAKREPRSLGHQEESFMVISFHIHTIYNLNILVVKCNFHLIQKCDLASSISKPTLMPGESSV